MKRFQSATIGAFFVLILLALVCASTSIAAPAKAKAATKATKYKVVKGSLLRVDVYHTAKHVIAKSKKMKGLVTLHSTKGKMKLSGTLSVRIKSLKSGNRRRNKVMWSSLGKSRQPYIYFYPGTLTLNGANGTIEGTFQIRKVKKKVTMKVSKFSGKLDGKSSISLTITGKLKCSDFKVKRPSLLFVKIKDVVDVKLALKLKPTK